ncbi:MAG: hypothetical protein CR982_04900 [Candidatus Cloacimonadota bacterium]|nr:MAG: hypothetical protein CR982_04900 [Candidatus Cloacimonadota bacterium]PIE77371.1 MAG: hypothetical protein CSA15_13295 [Candidatus Delongbacteria bacterium]
MNTLKLLLISALALLLISCNESSSSSNDTGEVNKTTVDASNPSKWAYFSFEKGETVEVSDEQTDEWDIAFKRMMIKTNSGTSGSGDGGVINFAPVEFDDVDSAPMGYYVVDDTCGIEAMHLSWSGNKALFDWYVMTGGMKAPHLDSKGYSYIVKNGDRYTKLKLDSYYDPETEVSGFITFTWKTGLEQSTEMVDNVMEASVTAPNEDEWVYFSFAEGEVLPLKDGEEPDGWDIAFQKYRMKTNSGVNHTISSDGENGYGVVMIETTDPFASIRTAPAEGYVVDSEIPDPQPGHAPYNGNSVLSQWLLAQAGPPQVKEDAVFFIKAEKYSYVKLKMTNYNYQSNEISFKFERYITAE